MNTPSKLADEEINRRLRNDLIPLRPLNELQRSAVKNFLHDSRIKLRRVESCPICGETDSATVAQKDQFGIPLETVCCKGCGLLYSKNQLDAPSTAIFYDEYYRKIYEGVSGPSLEHDFYKKLFSGGVPPVPAFLDNSYTVFEFGCGGGWNLLPFKLRGIPHVGYDYDSAMVRFGREKYGMNLFIGGVAEALASGIKADYVILSHVLEHVSDPIKFLESMASTMKTGSLIRITVPCINYLRFFGGSGTSHDFGLVLQNAHNFTFSERTLNAVIRRAGFVPVVLIGGFCLAKYVGPQQDVAPQNSAEFESTTALINSAERHRILKSKFLGALPGKARSIFLYCYQFTRPVSLLKYYVLFRLKAGKALIAKTR